MPGVELVLDRPHQRQSRDHTVQPAACGEFLADGHAKRFAMYRERNEKLRAGLAALGVPSFTHSGRESHSIVTCQLPEGVALKVPVDEHESDALEAALELFLAREDVRAEMGRAAGELARRRHDLERVAELYAAALEEAGGGRAVADTVLHEVSEAAADVGIEPATPESAELAKRLAEVDLGG